MPTPYQYALVAARFFGLLDVISGLAIILVGILFFVPIGMLHYPWSNALWTVTAFALPYGISILATGVAVLMFSKPLARFASGFLK
jgi:hypothetical protein